MNLSPALNWFVCLLVISSGICTAETPLVKQRFPLSRADHLRTPTFLIDLSEVPEDAHAKAWSAEAQILCEEWFPVISRFLATDDWTAPETVRLVMKRELDAPGVAGGDTIQISVKWITEHPDDFGMVIHELTHIIQAYPGRGEKPGWLVEGIADYIRYWKYEPELPRRPIDRRRASYRQGYGTTASFLAWIVRKYDRRLILKLDAALRTGAYHGEMFQDLTGKSLDDLWTEFLDDQAEK